jgi:hypothetical protein
MKLSRQAVLAIACTFISSTGSAQGSNSIDLTVNNVGISIGDSHRVTGIRLNYRDSDLRKVTGINATIWMPYEHSRGDVRGLALGVPATGARNIDGIALGLVGIGTMEDMRGIAVGGIGMGVGNDMKGIAIGGIGLGAGSDMKGIAAGGDRTRHRAGSYGPWSWWNWTWHRPGHEGNRSRRRWRRNRW